MRRAALIRTEAELDRLRADTFVALLPTEDLWIFGHGSQVWNPSFDVAERRPARLSGFHRSLCFKSTFERGNKDLPGLTLALDLGGACNGVALMMARTDRVKQLKRLWQHEMLTQSSRALWVRTHTPEGSVRAIAFIANRSASNYVGRLPEKDVAAHIARACGRLGANFDYLARTQAGLAEHGVSDPYLGRLLALCSDITPSLHRPAD